MRWHDQIIDVNKLYLDLENPRIPKHIKEHHDETLIRNYLLEKEDVLRIAKSIASNGYHKSAVSIVCQEKNKLIVLDGNRRLAACQLLLNPGLSPNAKDKKELEVFSKLMDEKELKKVKITVAPSRKEAEREIWDIHVNRLLKSWEQLQRLRMYRNLINEKEFDILSAAKEYGTTKGVFATELAKLYFYEWILEIGDISTEEKMREVGFNAIERLILSKNGKKLLDYIVSKEGLVTFKNKKKSEQKLKRLIPYIIGDKKISAQANQNDLVNYVFSKVDPGKFSLKKVSKKRNNKKTSHIIKSEKIGDGYFKKLALRRRRNSRQYPLSDAEEIVDYILVHLNIVAEQLLDRYNNRSTLKIDDEYDVQDLLHSLLAMFFDDVAAEVWNPSCGTSSSRSDFLLLDNGTIIEVKTTLKRKGDHGAIRKKIEEELNDDLMKYSKRSDCRIIYLFVYDPEKKIKKPTTFERGIASNKFKNIKVRAIVNRD